jgi:S1 RNA binding domain protein
MQLEVGSILEGKVTGITNFGAFVELPGGKTGMVHISEVAPTYVKEIRDHLTDNQMVKVKVMAITPEGKINLSIKRAMDQPQPQSRPNQPSGRPPQRRGGSSGGIVWMGNPKREPSGPQSFEDMINRFKQTSDDKISDLKRVTDSKRGGSGRRGPR